MKTKSSQTTAFDLQVMRKLIKLAATKKGISSPNPLVAAAVTLDNTIIAKGVHDVAGTSHAEILALEKAGVLAKGATLYVTLEPCTHHGKTPPCVNAIIAAGIKKVIYAMDDPNPLVKNNPARKILEEHNIEVISGLLEQEAKILNEVFIKNQTQKKPFVTLKVAETLDGKIALPDGRSKYITSAKSLKLVHKLRAENDAILIGINTVLVDDPSLDIRFGIKPKKKSRYVVVLDSQLRTPLTSKFFQKNQQVIIVTSEKNKDSKKYASLKEKAIGFITMPEEGNLDLTQIVTTLYRDFGITSILIEGGKKVFTDAVTKGVVDKAYFFIAPKLILGEDSISAFGGKSVANLEEAILLKKTKVKYLNPDILITGYF